MKKKDNWFNLQKSSADFTQEIFAEPLSFQ